MDFTNGAATATLDALSLLAQAGFECQAFCNTHVDAWEEVLVEEILAQRGVRYEVRNAQIGRYKGRMIFTSHGPVPVTLFNSASTRGAWQSPEEIGAFLSGCELFLRKNRPDLVWTYGGDAVSVLLHKIVRTLGIPLLFSLHNFSYLDGGIFHPSDRVAVPTEFARQFYRKAIGLECEVLPLVMDAERVKVAGTRRVPPALTYHAERDEHETLCPGDTQNVPVTGDGTQRVPATIAAPLPAGEGNYVTFVNPTPLGVETGTQLVLTNWGEGC
jgi:hypothetical protein